MCFVLFAFVCVFLFVYDVSVVRFVRVVIVVSVVRVVRVVRVVGVAIEARCIHVIIVVRHVSDARVDVVCV